MAAIGGMTPVCIECTPVYIGDGIYACTTCRRNMGIAYNKAAMELELWRTSMALVWNYMGRSSDLPKAMDTASEIVKTMKSQGHDNNTKLEEIRTLKAELALLQTKYDFALEQLAIRRGTG